MRQMYWRCGSQDVTCKFNYQSRHPIPFAPCLCYLINLLAFLLSLYLQTSAAAQSNNSSRHNLARIPLRWTIRQCFLANTGIRFHAPLLATVGIDPASFTQSSNHVPLRSSALPRLRRAFPRIAQPTAEDASKPLINFAQPSSETTGDSRAVRLGGTGPSFFPRSCPRKKKKKTSQMRSARSTGSGSPHSGGC